MKIENLLKSKIKEVLENLKTEDEYCIAKEYCIEGNYMDSEPFRIDDIDEILGEMKPSEIIEKYGELSTFHSSYFYYNGYANVTEWNELSDTVSIEELTEYIIDNEDSLYNDEIQSILDEYSDIENELEDIIEDMIENQSEISVENLILELEERTESENECLFEDSKEEIEKFIKEYLENRELG